MKIAMISYNVFAPGEINGWKKGVNNDILVLQEGAVNLPADSNELDKIIIYIGRHGAEDSIKMMKDNQVPDWKLIFVMCDCEIAMKRKTLEDSGYTYSRQIISECGGLKNMIGLYNDFLKS